LRFGDHPLDIEVAALVTKAAKQFEKLGCKVEEVEAPFPYPAAGRAFVIHWLTALQRLLQLFPESRHNEFDPNLLASAKAGLRYSLQDVINAHVMRRELAIAWNLFFDKYDLLLSPAVAVQPFEVGKNLPEGPERTCRKGGKARPMRCGPLTPRSSPSAGTPRRRCRVASAARACRSACR